MAKQKKSSKKAIPYIIMALVCLIGIIFSFMGAIGLLNLNLAHEKEKVKCDEKDYSAYVKKTETQTPGNENINRQIDLYKRAMDNALEAGDYNAYGQLNDEYTKMLTLQAQTSTTNVSYDYSEAEKAKSKCYSLAEEQKNIDRVKSIIFLSVGASALAGSIIYGAVYLCKKTRG